MSNGTQYEQTDWNEISQITREARETGLAIFCNDFSAPQAQHNSLGSEGNHSFGLVLTVAEDDAIRARDAAAGTYTNRLEHPRTQWAPTPKMALLASLALLEGRPKA